MYVVEFVYLGEWCIHSRFKSDEGAKRMADWLSGNGHLTRVVLGKQL